MACTHDQVLLAGEELANHYRFLLPALQIQTILEKTTRKKMSQTLDTLSESLENTFKEMINRLQSQGGDRARLIHKALMWISNANRKLKVRELCQALAIEKNSESLDEDDIPISEHIVRFSCGLIVIDQKSSEIRLMHSSLQTYLEVHQKDLFAEAHEIMANVCLTALTFDASYKNNAQPESLLQDLSVGLQRNPLLRSLTSDPESARQDVEARLNEFPFLRYAAIHWGYHERQVVNTSNTDLAFRYLDSQSCLRSACQIGGYEDSYEINGTWRYAAQETREALHILAFFGLHRLATTYLQRDTSRINNQDSRGNTALIIAAREGHLNCVRVLAEFGANIQLSKTVAVRAPRTALVVAASRGNDPVVKYLIHRQFGEQPIRDCSDRFARLTALQASVEAGMSNHDSTVEILRNAGCHVLSESPDDSFLARRRRKLVLKGFDLYKDHYGSQ